MSHPDPPLHIPRRDLVGPLVRFRGQRAPVPTSPPRDTLDPRWAQCVDHHLACDCREAEQNERLNEHRAEWHHIEEVLGQMIRGHATEVRQDDYQPRPDLECQCQLCEFARRARMVTPWGANSRTVPTGTTGVGRYPF